MSSPALVVGKAMMAGKSWYPDLEDTDELLRQLCEIRKTQPVVTTFDVTDVIDELLLYRRELDIKQQEKELKWPQMNG